MKGVVSIPSFALAIALGALPSTPASAREGAPAPPPPEFVPAAPITLPAAPEPEYRALDQDQELRRDLVRVNLGLRIGYVATSGFDTFASNDVLPQMSIDGAVPVLIRRNLVLAVGLGWDAGGRSEKLRGFDASLTAHRLYVPLEARYHLTPRIYAFGKLAPGAVASVVSVKEDSSPTLLSTTGWAFSGDASAGASVLLGRPRKPGKQRAIQFWLTPELGWAYTTAAPLRLDTEREEKDMLGQDESMTLRSLALSGVFWRVSLAATF